MDNVENLIVIWTTISPLSSECKMTFYPNNFIVNTKTLPPIVTFYDVISGYDPEIFTADHAYQVAKFAGGDRTNPQPGQEVHYLDLYIYYEDGYRKSVVIQLNYATGKLRKMLFQKKLTTITIPKEVMELSMTHKRKR